MLSSWFSAFQSLAYNAIIFGASLSLLFSLNACKEEEDDAPSPKPTVEELAKMALTGERGRLILYENDTLVLMPNGTVYTPAGVKQGYAGQWFFGFGGPFAEEVLYDQLRIRRPLQAFQTYNYSYEGDTIVLREVLGDVYKYKTIYFLEKQRLGMDVVVPQEQTNARYTTLIHKGGSNQIGLRLFDEEGSFSGVALFGTDDQQNSVFVVRGFNQVGDYETLRDTAQGFGPHFLRFEYCSPGCTRLSHEQIAPYPDSLFVRALDTTAFGSISLAWKGSIDDDQYGPTEASLWLNAHFIN